ncbi:hypothetical protein VPH35_136741 [Triticum aestivum]
MSRGSSVLFSVDFNHWTKPGGPRASPSGSSSPLHLDGRHRQFGRSAATPSPPTLTAAPIPRDRCCPCDRLRRRRPLLARATRWWSPGSRRHLRRQLLLH